jgi:hypothetical protein
MTTLGSLIYLIFMGVSHSDGGTSEGHLVSAGTKVSKRGKTFEQRFLEELTRQCNGQDIAVLNGILRAQLGWQDERFDQVRTNLIKKGVIKARPGPGGKTTFASLHEMKPTKKSLKVFISYAHADEGMKDQFLQHLKPLERLGLIESWHDRMIKPGDRFSEVISTELEDAHIIFLLVSVDFINYKYCYDIELTGAIERHKSGSVRVIPIILRDCLWNHSPFGGLQALPKDAKAVASLPDHDEAFTTIAKAVHELSVELLVTDVPPLSNDHFGSGAAAGCAEF